MKVRANDGQTQTGNGWGAFFGQFCRRARRHGRFEDPRRDEEPEGVPRRELARMIIRAENPLFTRGGTWMGRSGPVLTGIRGVTSLGGT